MNQQEIDDHFIIAVRQELRRARKANTASPTTGDLVADTYHLNFSKRLGTSDEIHAAAVRLIATAMRVALDG